MNINDAITILNKEIKWCEENPDRNFSKDYRKGFKNGLIQAKSLLSEFELQFQEGYDEIHREDCEHGEWIKLCVLCGDVLDDSREEKVTGSKGSAQTSRSIYVCMDYSMTSV